MNPNFEKPKTLKQIAEDLGVPYVESINAGPVTIAQPEKNGFLGGYGYQPQMGGSEHGADQVMADLQSGHVNDLGKEQQK